MRRLFCFILLTFLRGESLAVFPSWSAVALAGALAGVGHGRLEARVMTEVGGALMFTNIDITIIIMMIAQSFFPKMHCALNRRCFCKPGCSRSFSLPIVDGRPPSSNRRWAERADIQSQDALRQAYSDRGFMMQCRLILA